MQIIIRSSGGACWLVGINLGWPRCFVKGLQVSISEGLVFGLVSFPREPSPTSCLRRIKLYVIADKEDGSLTLQYINFHLTLVFSMTHLISSLSYALWTWNQSLHCSVSPENKPPAFCWREEETVIWQSSLEKEPRGSHCCFQELLSTIPPTLSVSTEVHRASDTLTLSRVPSWCEATCSLTAKFLFSEVCQIS